MHTHMYTYIYIYIYRGRVETAEGWNGPALSNRLYVGGDFGAQGSMKHLGRRGLDCGVCLVKGHAKDSTA